MACCKNRFASIVVLASSIGLIQACSSSSNSTSEEQGSQCLDQPGCIINASLWHGLGGSLHEAFEDQIEIYNASQSKFRINASRKGNYPETLEAGLEGFRSGDYPTVLQVFEAGTATIAAENLSISIPELEQRTSIKINTDNFFSIISDYYSHSDGKLLSMPHNSSSPVLYINTDALDRAGLDELISTRTWNDVEAIATTLRDQGQSCSITTSWQSWIHLENLSAYHNVSFATEGNGIDGLSAELTFASDFHINHIARLNTWRNSGLFRYFGQFNNSMSEFLNGNCAMLTTSSANYTNARDDGSFNFKVVPLPYYDQAGAPQNTIVGGASLWVMKGKSEEEYYAVADFFKHLSSAEIQAKWHRDTGYLPISSEAYQLSKNQGLYNEEPGLEVAVIQLLENNPTTNSRGVRLGNFVEIREIINEELENVWSGNKSAREALISAQSQGNELLRSFEDENDSP